MSTNVASILYKTALDTPLLHIEDVYVTGKEKQYINLFNLL